MRFEPAGCAMLSVDGRQLARALRPNQRLMLIGDSHIRQVRGADVVAHMESLYYEDQLLHRLLCADHMNRTV